MKKGEQDVPPNVCPASISSRRDRSTLNPQSKARPPVRRRATWTAQFERRPSNPKIDTMKLLFLAILLAAVLGLPAQADSDSVSSVPSCPV